MDRVEWGLVYPSDVDGFSFFASNGWGGESRISRGTHLVFSAPFTMAPLPSIHSMLPSTMSPFSIFTFTLSPGLGTGEVMARSGPMDVLWINPSVLEVRLSSLGA